MTQHTPGPWTFHDDGERYEIMHEAPDSEPGPLAAVFYAPPDGDDGEDRDGEALANAHLIVTAPILLQVGESLAGQALTFAIQFHQREGHEDDFDACGNGACRSTARQVAAWNAVTDRPTE